MLDMQYYLPTSTLRPVIVSFVAPPTFDRAGNKYLAILGKLVSDQIITLIWLRLKQQRNLCPSLNLAVS